MKTSTERRIAGTALLLAALVLVPAALAGKGGNAAAGGGGGGGGYTVSVDQAAPYRFGQEITVTTNAPVTTSTWIDLGCYQGSAKVLATTHAGFPDGWYYGTPFKLGPTAMWTGGAASCELLVWHQSRNKRVVDARTTFGVDG